MPLERYGSKPEVQDFGSDEWVAQNFTFKEWDHKGGKDGRGGPKKKIGLPDQRKLMQSYREGWDRIFGNKNQ